MKKLLFILAFSLATAPLYCPETPPPSSPPPASSSSGNGIGTTLIIAALFLGAGACVFALDYYRTRNALKPINNNPSLSSEDLKTTVPPQTSIRSDIIDSTNEKMAQSKPEQIGITTGQLNKIMNSESVKSTTPVPPPPYIKNQVDKEAPKPPTPSMQKNPTPKTAPSAEDHMREFDFNDSFNGTY